MHTLIHRFCAWEGVDRMRDWTMPIEPETVRRREDSPRGQRRS